MTIFFKAIACTMITVILGLILSRQGKDMWVLLSIAVCCMIITAAVEYLQPIIKFFENLQDLGNIDPQLFQILMKSVCIGILSEITSLLCSDSGNAALGKGIQLLAIAVIIWISLPLLEKLLSLIESILGSV